MNSPPLAAWLFVGLEVYFTGGSRAPPQSGGSSLAKKFIILAGLDALPSNRCYFILNHLVATQ
jgi:hypothetical protein